MTNLCREAALGPIRSIPFERMETITPDQVKLNLLQLMVIEKLFRSFRLYEKI